MPGVVVIVQRCDEASLLVDNVDEWVHIGKGLVLNVSFSKVATPADVDKATQTLLSIPLMTAGQWGDATKPAAITSLLQDGHEVSILVIPQASLVSKVRGKTLQVRRLLCLCSRREHKTHESASSSDERSFYVCDGLRVGNNVLLVVAPPIHLHPSSSRAVNNKRYRLFHHTPPYTHVTPPPPCPRSTTSRSPLTRVAVCSTNSSPVCVTRPLLAPVVRAARPRRPRPRAQRPPPP